MFTIPCEAVFNNHPSVFRSALVGPGKRGRQFPVMIVEPLEGAFPKTRKQAKIKAGTLRNWKEESLDRPNTDYYVS